MSGYFKLDKLGDPVPCKSSSEFFFWKHDNGDRLRLALGILWGDNTGTTISTIFVGTPEVMWETIICSEYEHLGGEWGFELWETYDDKREALVGHAHAVDCHTG